MNVVIKVGKKDLAYHNPKAFEARLREELSRQQGLSISSLAISFVNEPDSTATVNERAYSEQVNPIVKAVGTTCFNLCAEAGEFCEDDRAAEAFEKRTGRKAYVVSKPDVPEADGE